MVVLAIYARNKEGEKIVGDTVRLFQFTYPNYGKLSLLRSKGEGNVDIKMLEIEPLVELLNTPTPTLLGKVLGR